MSDTWPRACVFCGRTPLTDEHVLGRWMTPLFPKEGTYEARAPVGTAEPQTYRKLNTAFVAHAVCVDCNTGWMNSTIEIPAQRVGLGQTPPLVVVRGFASGRSRAERFSGPGAR